MENSLIQVKVSGRIDATRTFKSPGAVLLFLTNLKLEQNILVGKQRISDPALLDKPLRYPDGNLLVDENKQYVGYQYNSETKIFKGKLSKGLEHLKIKVEITDVNNLMADLI